MRGWRSVFALGVTTGVYATGLQRQVKTIFCVRYLLLNADYNFLLINSIGITVTGKNVLQVYERPSQCSRTSTDCKHSGCRIDYRSEA